MEFGIEKCAMVIMKSQERETTERIELKNLESLKNLGEKENYKHIGLLKVDTIIQTEMKK